MEMNFAILFEDDKLLMASATVANWLRFYCTNKAIKVYWKKLVNER